MSDSDDTDVLLLIPPDLFLVPSSSESDATPDICKKKKFSKRRSGVISELVGHMQSLETRISAIESKDNSLEASLLNQSFESQLPGNSSTKHRQTLPRFKFSVSQTSSLQNSPVKHQKSFSIPTTPNSYIPISNTNTNKNDITPRCCYPSNGNSNIINSNLNDKYKHDTLMSHLDHSLVTTVPCDKIVSHAGNLSTNEESYFLPSTDYNANKNSKCSNSYNQLYSSISISDTAVGSLEKFYHKPVEEMEISEVNELLQEMDATEMELSKRLSSINLYHNQVSQSTTLQSYPNVSPKRKLDFQDTISESQKNGQNEVSSQNNVYQTDGSSKMIADFKIWKTGLQQTEMKNKNSEFNDIQEQKFISGSLDNYKIKSNIENCTLSNKNNSSNNELNTANINGVFSKVLPTVRDMQSLDIDSSSHKEQKNDRLSEFCNPEIDFSIFPQEKLKEKIHAYSDINTENPIRKRQQILSLSDFWDTNTTKSENDMLKIKLEEERFRREHCEHLIQELQKKLLEQQEKVAVAVRVDNEKNVLISQFHTAWKKLKQRVQQLEKEYENLQSIAKTAVEKRESEILEFQAQIKRLETELSKALDLAAGYKEKSDGLVVEKVNLLKSHADELENYKSLVQEAEKRYEIIKGEYNKLLEQNQKMEDNLKTAHHDLNRERLKGGEVRNEMGVIHKALDTCEAELTILRQEKENLQLKLKEEINRNTILEEKKNSLLTVIEEAQKAEKAAKSDVKTLAEQQEKIKSELQDVYQKQVDTVVKGKLQEFQTQLDAAESEFLTELENRQRVIAECAARKIKDIIDKHKLEINLLEEKHEEEKRLHEIQIAQIVQKAVMLEAQLNSQQASKTQLAEQLHSVMQKQWQQALQIITGGNIENLTPIQRLNVERFFDVNVPKKSESMPNCYTKISQEVGKWSLEQSDTTKIHKASYQEQNANALAVPSYSTETPLTSRRGSRDDLRKYIKMIAEMQHQNIELIKNRDSTSSPTPICREVPRKHYLRKDVSVSEDSNLWQPLSETSAHDVTEYLPVSQKSATKEDKQRVKRPWK